MKTLLAAFCILFIIGCSSNGKIVYRDNSCTASGVAQLNENSKGIFLINTSNSKKITYTLKNSFKNSTNNETLTVTKTYTLNPGEELFIDCTSRTVYNTTKEDVVFDNQFEVVGEHQEK